METSDRPNRPSASATDALSAALQGLPESERTLLIVDDDAPLCQRLARAMERRGFVPRDDRRKRRRRHRRGDRSAAGFRRCRHAAGRRPRLRCRHRVAAGPSGRPHRHADRLRQHRDRGRGGQGWGDRLSAEAGRRRRGQAAPRPGRRDSGTARGSHVSRPGALGAHPAGF